MPEKKEKSKAEKMQEKLLMKPENAGLRMTDKEIETAFNFCEAYKSYLDLAKTEREAVDITANILCEKGFKLFDPTVAYKPGDKIYQIVHGKAIIFATIGKKPLSEGVKILASHIDSPRVDLKPRPLYEEAQLAMFKTHYYGGIRKYQWVAIPLALHGTVLKADGTSVNIVIGEHEADPVFCMNDLLPHLATEQSQRKLSEGIKGEELNVLIGSIPFRDDKISEKVKLNIISIINEKYGLTEADFLSADLALVPAWPARDVGFDRSMIGAYGHDDRVCAYTSIMAGLDVTKPEYTWVSVLADREEIGSYGNTGLNSRLLEYFIADLGAPHGIEGRHILQKSECLSADVNAAFDPTFSDVSERRNTAYLGYGLCLTKYMGSCGKSGTNEAGAEFTGKVRNIFDKAGVIWQTGELGKVDIGGSGTVAMYISKLGAEVIDAGVPVLSMHAPMEIVSKLDVYSAYLGFKAFISAK